MKTFKKILKWAAIAFGAIVAIFLILNAVFVWRSDIRLEGQLASVRAAGDPITLADLAGAPVPPAENAATFLRRARNDIESFQQELLEVMRSESWGKGYPSQEELKAIESALDAYPRILPLLEQAAACEHYNPDRDYTLTTEAFMSALMIDHPDRRGVARLLRARVLTLLARGDREHAVDTCILLFRLCRHFDREPMFVGYLVTMACRGIGIDLSNRVLRAGLVSNEAREALESELVLHGGVEEYLWALKTERSYWLETFRAMPARNNWFVRAFWNRAESPYLELFDRQLAIASRPYSEYRAAALEQDTKSKQSLSPSASLLFPSMQILRDSMERTRTNIQCLRVLNSLQRHTQKTNEIEPKLADLNLPADVTTDPFTGKPLIVKKLSKGWLIYSVGTNLQDDGGKLKDNSDFGVGPESSPVNESVKENPGQNGS